MQFTDSAWALLENFYPAICLSLPRSNNPLFDLLTADAYECGLDPQEHNIWAGINPMENKTFVIVGERIFESGNYPVYAFDMMKLSGIPEIIFFRPWHVALKLRGNPLGLHLHWAPDYELEIDIKIPTSAGDRSTTEIIRHAGALCKELSWIQELFKPNQGGAPQHNANAWLIEQVLNNNRDRKDLTDEWLERRKKEGKPVPTDVGKAMREVIREGKERRAKTPTRKPSD